MNGYRVHMVLLTPGIGLDRTDLEKIEGSYFDSKEVLLKSIGEECMVLSASEFMDWINNHDDDMEISERFKPEEWFIGYVHIKSQQS